MVKKIKMLYPADITSEDTHDMHILHFNILKQLQYEYDVEVVGRISEEDFRKTCDTKLPYRDFFDNKIFRNQNFSESKIDDVENYIQLPINFIYYCNQKRWGWLNKNNYIDNLIKYVDVWKEILTDTDVLITTLDNLFLVYVAECVAKRKNIKIIKIIKGRIIDDSIVFWDYNNNPIKYKECQDTKIYELFSERVYNLNTTVKNYRKAINKESSIRNSIISIPKKMFVLLNDWHRKYDIDSPNFIMKYYKLIIMGLKIVFYPKIHGLFFEKTRNEKYFLFPLHFEWESQLAFREPFISQIELAKQIANSLPQNTYLYIKVHPHWKNIDQKILDIYSLKQYKNIRIINPTQSTADLILHSMGVICINSTVGYETVLIKKPLIVIGHEYYKEIGIDIKDMNELPEVLIKIKSGEYKVNENENIEFLGDYTNRICLKEDAFKNLKTIIEQK